MRELVYVKAAGLKKIRGKDLRRNFFLEKVLGSIVPKKAPVTKSFFIKILAIDIAA